MSHSEKASCSPSGFLRMAQTAAATAEHRGTRGHSADPAVPPSSCLCVGTKQHLRAQPRPPPCVPAFVTTAASVLYPARLSAHWRYQKFQILKAVSVFSVCMLGFYNGSWPEKVQHLPHTDIGPFPVLGISVLGWSSSDSNFKMFSAAMSWQDSTSFPIPWLIRGGWEEQLISDTNSFLLFLGKSLYSTWNPWTLER